MPGKGNFILSYDNNKLCEWVMEVKYQNLSKFLTCYIQGILYWKCPNLLNDRYTEIISLDM